MPYPTRLDASPKTEGSVLVPSSIYKVLYALVEASDCKQADVWLVEGHNGVEVFRQGGLKVGAVVGNLSSVRFYNCAWG